MEMQHLCVDDRLSIRTRGGCVVGLNHSQGCLCCISMVVQYLYEWCSKCGIFPRASFFLG